MVSELDIAPAALWVTFTFAAMLGLNRAFLLEQENRALDGMLLTTVPRSGIFLGKVLGNLGFVVVVELISLPLFALFFNVAILHALPELLVVTAMATLAFVAVGTLLSAMVVRTRWANGSSSMVRATSRHRPGRRRSSRRDGPVSPSTIGASENDRDAASSTRSRRCSGRDMSCGE